MKTTNLKLITTRELELADLTPLVQREVEASRSREGCALPRGTR